MTNKRDLKAYVRYDGSGRVIAGSLVLRRKKPAVGNWHEIQGYECCNAPTLNSGTIDSFPWTSYIDIVVYCNGESNQYVFSSLPNTIEPQTIQELVSALNLYASNYGTFSIGSDGESINLTLSNSMLESYKDCINDLGFEVFPD